MIEVGNATNTLEFLTCALRQCGGKLTSDDFTKLASTCNVLKEEKKKEEKVTTAKKGKKKGKVLVSMKKTTDTWQDQMFDDDGGDFDDDFMYICLFEKNKLVDLNKHNNPLFNSNRFSNFGKIETRGYTSQVE